MVVIKNPHKTEQGTHGFKCVSREMCPPRPRTIPHAASRRLPACSVNDLKDPLDEFKLSPKASLVCALAET